MIYEIPASRRFRVTELARLLEGKRRVILTTHLNADGDGAGCEAALLSLLLERGIEGWIVNPTPFPELFRFLLPDPGRVLDAAGAEAEERSRTADLCVVLDTGEKSRIGRVNPLVEGIPLAVIDHHPPGEDPLEGFSLRDSTAAAAGELVFDLAQALEGPWTRSVLEGLYVALLTDTGSFRFSNSTPRAHRITAELIERGAVPDVLHRRVYGNVPARRFHLLQEALSSLGVSEEGRVAWMTVPADRFAQLGCTSEDLDGLVDYPRELEGVEVGLLFRELEGGSVKVSLRSNEFVDVNAAAREFGGGGHVRAAGALVKGRVEEVREAIVRRMEALTKRDGRGREVEAGEGEGDAALSPSRVEP
jgi:bifunctional oligoribonuclease and PAP phosphatase NrnA